MSEFSKILRELRTTRDKTQDELAKALDVSKSAISMYENGNRKPDFETLEAIADYFNVDIDYLLGRETQQSSYFLDAEATEYLDELHKRPEMKTLFSVSKKATVNDIKTAINIIEALQKKAQGED